MAVLTKRRIAILEGGTRFWVFPQIQGDVESLYAALDICKSYSQVGDHFVFLGSQIGAAGQSLAVMDELVVFRAWVEQNLSDDSVLWLRGIQEELIERLFTLHMAQEPGQVLDWMVSEHGIDHLIYQFGFNVQDVKAAATQGAAALARLTGDLRQTICEDDGTAAYFDHCARAAVSDQGHLLFVHGGVDPARTLSLQTDAFWWGHPDFFRLQSPYQSFTQVISTLTPRGQTRIEGPGRLAVDHGCGRGGSLSIFCIDPRGQELFNYSFAEEKATS